MNSNENNETDKWKKDIKKKKKKKKQKPNDGKRGDQHILELTNMVSKTVKYWELRVQSTLCKWQKETNK